MFVQMSLLPSHLQNCPHLYTYWYVFLDEFPEPVVKIEHMNDEEEKEEEEQLASHLSTQKIIQTTLQAVADLQPAKKIANTKPKKDSICSICSKNFRTTRSLKDHMNTHTGERPYKCKLCPAAYTQSSHLSVHVRMHTGERPYKCTVCEKCFRESKVLKVHMRIHASEKP